MGPVMRGATWSPGLGSHFRVHHGPRASHMFGDTLEGLIQPAVMPMGEIYYSVVGRMHHWLRREKAQWSLEDSFIGFLLLALSHVEITRALLPQEQKCNNMRSSVPRSRLGIWSCGHSLPLRYHTSWLQAGKRVSAWTILFAQTV